MSFKINRKIRSGVEEVDEYITSLESFIDSISVSSTHKLILKLDELNGAIADDLDHILEYGIDDSDGSMLRVLNDSKDSKIFERLMVLYSKMKEIQAVKVAKEELIPEEEETEKKNKTIIKEEIKGNVFEIAQRKVIK